jgi:hypothetical protein
MSKGKLGIIAGGGGIPHMLIKHCIDTGREFFVLALKDNADEDLVDSSMPHLWIRIGQAGTGFDTFKKENVKEVVMIGVVKRPSVFDIVPDLKTAALLAKIGVKALGDDGILRVLANEIESEGMKVIGVHEVLTDILVKKGIYGKVKPDKQAILDIERGVEVALKLGEVDVGQAVIVQQGLVLAVEGIEGTDKLISRSKDYARGGVGGILIKLKKPQQDMRLDLPTIGTETVKKAHESGLRGIAVHEGNMLIADEAEVIKLADKLGLFIIGINPSEEIKV